MDIIKLQFFKKKTNSELFSKYVPVSIIKCFYDFRSVQYLCLIQNLKDTLQVQEDFQTYFHFLAESENLTTFAQFPNQDYEEVCGLGEVNSSSTFLVLLNTIAVEVTTELKI